MSRRWIRFDSVALAVVALVCALTLPLFAQPVVQPATPATPRTSQPNAGTPSRPGIAAPSDDPMAVPSFWDPRRRPERPDLSRINGIRFLTEFDYPPFNYTGADGQLAGFNIDLARLICEEIKTTCTVQARRFDTLIEALTTNNGDTVIASLAATPDIRRRIDFSDPYYRTPARFVSRKDVEIDGVRPTDLEGKRIGAITGTAHEAYLRTLFTEAELHSYANSDELRAALRRGEVDLLFGDGIALSFWLNGTDSAGCCVFRGGPFIESRFFGEGVGLAVRRGNDLMRQAINWALFRLWENGKYTDLWLRYFPISPF